VHPLPPLVFQRDCTEYRFLNPHCVSAFRTPPPRERVSARVSHDTVFPRSDGLHPVHNGWRSKALDIHILYYIVPTAVDIVVCPRPICWFSGAKKYTYLRSFLRNHILLLGRWPCGV